VRYEWDEAKNRRNQQKHDGISFEAAALIFDDEHCLVRLDRIDKTGEQRWQAIGAAHVETDGNGEEITRIISARRAEKRDIRRYQEQALE
jgi:uncharacterized DUF497 family protein